MRVCVIGLGYVGAVTAVCLARDGHAVIGIDLDPVKLDLLRRGPAADHRRGHARTSRARRPTAAASRSPIASTSASRRCDLIFVCVGTPSAPNGSQNLVAVERGRRADRQRRCKAAKDYHVVVVRSTIYRARPTRSMRPMLEKPSGKVANRDFGLCFQPEFLREGSSIKDYYKPPFTIVGGDSTSACDRAGAAAVRLDLPCEFIAPTVAHRRDAEATPATPSTRSRSRSRTRSAASARRSASTRAR